MDVTELREFKEFHRMRIRIYKGLVPCKNFIELHVFPDLPIHELKRMVHETFQKDLYQFVFVYNGQFMFETDEESKELFFVPPVYRTKRTAPNRWVFEIFNGQTMTFESFDEFSKMEKILSEGSTSAALKDVYDQFILHRKQTVRALTLEDYKISEGAELCIFVMNYLSVLATATK